MTSMSQSINNLLKQAHLQEKPNHLLVFFDQYL